MYTLLSPAKKLHEPPAAADVAHSQPQLLDQASRLAARSKKLSAKKLKALMHISDNLANLNHQRFQDWSTPFTPDNSRQAILSFAGDVYLGLDAGSLGADDLDWAQDNVGILSGLYGLLRPLDLMQPYRLEMGIKLSTRRGKSLYEYWGGRLTKAVNAAETDTVINLASNEYFSSVQTKKLTARVVTPVFRDEKAGKARTISFFAKKARGSMTRWIVDNRIEEAEELKACDAMGYVFRSDESTADRWVFQRMQP
jgi:hypothetical protein